MKTHLVLTQLVISFFISTQTYAGSLHVKWVGVAGVMLTDGTTTILIDPVPTKPNLMNWLLGAEFRSNPMHVKLMLEKAGITALNGVFLSHTHFDHAVDGPSIARELKAPLYGGTSIQRLAHAHDPSPEFREMTADTPIQIGKFKITPMRRDHAEILSFFEFLPGEIPEWFSFKFYQYKEGECWNFYIEHPDGTVLFDQGSRINPNNKKFAGQIGTYISGVANRISNFDWVINNVLQIQPKRVIPVHFDNFFLDKDWFGKSVVSVSELSDLESILKERNNSILWKRPFLYEDIELN